MKDHLGEPVSRVPVALVERQAFRRTGESIDMTFPGNSVTQSDGIAVFICNIHSEVSKVVLKVRMRRKEVRRFCLTCVVSLVHIFFVKTWQHVVSGLLVCFNLFVASLSPFSCLFLQHVVCKTVVVCWSFTVVYDLVPSFCSVDIYVSSRCSLFNISMYSFIYLASSCGHSSRPPTPPSQQPARPPCLYRRWPITLPTSATSTSTPHSQAAAWRWDPTPTSRCTRPRPPMCPSKPSTMW